MSVRDVYPFEAEFFGHKSSGFINQCTYCSRPPSWMAVQKVGKRRRVTSLCEAHAAGLGGEVRWHRGEKLSAKREGASHG